VDVSPGFSPYLLLKRSTTSALAERALAALTRWSAQWSALPGHSVDCADAATLAPLPAGAAPPRRRLLDDGSAIWIAVPEASERWLEQLVFGLDELDAASDRHRSARLGVEVAAIALEELLGALGMAMTGQPSHAAPFEAPAPALLRRGAGTVACTLRMGGRTMRVLVPAAALPAAAPPPRGAGLATLHQALAGASVALSVELCSTELTLGYLRTLAVGDVLALPMPLDQPLRVLGPGAAPLCAAHLGAQDGMRAVELITPPA
jgi:flagellar motor switch/type III secretory pathway protein FliN